ncbi:MAG: hypothetical protein AABW73_03305 [Nanoarchaeota archaeon]
MGNIQYNDPGFTEGGPVAKSRKEEKIRRVANEGELELAALSRELVGIIARDGLYTALPLPRGEQRIREYVMRDEDNMIMILDETAGAEKYKSGYVELSAQSGSRLIGPRTTGYSQIMEILQEAGGWNN